MKIVRELVNPTERSSLRFLALDMDYFDHPYHYHPELELTLIQKGRGSMLVGDAMRDYQPGEICLLGSHLPHQYRSLTTGSAALVIQFPLDALIARDKSEDPIPELLSLHRWLHSASRGILIENLPQKLQDQMHELFFMESNLDRYLGLMKLLRNLISIENQQHLASSVYSPQQKLGRLEQMNRLLSYIEQNASEELTLAMASEIAKCHPQSLSRIFREQLGQSFQNYLVETRLVNAARKLISSKNTVTEIAYEVGFRNLSNFNRLFKKKYAQSPSSYRKTYQGQ